MGTPVRLLSFGNNLLAMQANQGPPGLPAEGAPAWLHRRKVLPEGGERVSLLGCDLLRQVPPGDLSHALMAPWLLWVLLVGGGGPKRQDAPRTVSWGPGFDSQLCH